MIIYTRKHKERIPLYGFGIYLTFNKYLVFVILFHYFFKSYTQLTGYTDRFLLYTVTFLDSKMKKSNAGVAPYKRVLGGILLVVIFCMGYMASMVGKKRGSLKSSNRPKFKRNTVDPLDALLGDDSGDDLDGVGDIQDDEAFITNDLVPPEPAGGKSNQGQLSNSGSSKTLVFKGIGGITAYLSTVKFVQDKQQPLVDGLPHYTSYAFFGNGQKVLLHLTSPQGDPYWYVSLKDLMIKDSSGKNITPIIAFTSCDDPSVYPWLPESRCGWTIHEGPEVGW